MTQLHQPGGKSALPGRRTRKDGLTIREYLTNCPICTRAVYRDDPHTFIRQPVTGTVHDWCIPTGSQPI